MAGINLFLNGFIYPALLKYQSGSVAGRWIDHNKLQNKNIVAYRFESTWSLYFYSKKIIPNEEVVEKINAGSYVILATENRKDFDNAGIHYLVVGGIAVILHGFVRATADLDLMVAMNARNLKISS